MFDVFVATLRCPRCGTVSPPTTNTGIQTHLRENAYGLELTVWYSFDPIDLEIKNILDAGYALIMPPREVDRVQLLDIWICPACETEQWATVEIVGGRIERIEAVPMNRATLEAANFISDVNAELVAAALMDISPAELAERKLSSVEILRQRLE